jgi:hypothetical protein
MAMSGFGLRSGTTPSVEARAAVDIEVGHDRPEVAPGLVVIVPVVIVLVIKVGAKVGQEVVSLVGRYVDRSREAIVTHKHETIVALQNGSDGLAERILGEPVLDVPTDALDEFEEFLRFPFGLADDEDVGVNLVVALVEFVEEHGGFNLDASRAVYAREVS